MEVACFRGEWGGHIGTKDFSLTREDIPEVSTPWKNGDSLMGQPPAFCSRFHQVVR